MLDPHQQRAVDCDDPRILLQAGAGSGKTRTLTARIQRLVAGGVHPREILALTFTRKAAAEMRERLEGQARRCLVSTFHSWAASLLREWHDLVPIARDFSIRDERDQDDLLKLVALEQGKTGKKGLERDVWATKPLHPRTRTRLLADADVMARYRQLLREAEALDYDLLEVELGNLLRREEVRATLARRYRHILVDEAQDTSQGQQELIDALVPQLAAAVGVENLFVVGDHGQSIYAFRGAHVEGFTGLSSRDRWTTLTIPRNYRSVPAVVEVANRCAAHMAVPGLQMEATREPVLAEAGREVSVLPAPTRDELFDLLATYDIPDVCHRKEGAAWRDMAILSPTWGLLEQLSEVLTAWEIPHEVARKRLDVWESDEMRWLLDCARVALNPWDHLALRQALLAFRPRVTPGQWATIRAECLQSGDSPWYGALRWEQESGRKQAPVQAISAIRSGAVGCLQVACDALDSELYALHLVSRVMTPAHEAVNAWLTANEGSALQDLLTWYSRRAITDPEVAQDTDKVTLLTIHGAKGLEWPCVWVIGLEEGVFPRQGADIEESRRLFYVACTRARDRLVLCTAGDHEPSRFLTEIQ